MTDRVTWLRAQLDADEQELRDGYQVVRSGYDYFAVCDLCGESTGRGDAENAEHAWNDHVERVHRKARVLRQVAAMRKIVDMCQAGVDPQTPVTPGVRAGYRAILGNLATIYADRDGYNPEWAPE